MKKYKILIVHNYYKIAGGEDSVVQNEKRMLEAHGHQVFLYVRNNSEIHGFGLIKKAALFFRAIFSIKTYREVKKIISEKGIDIVHVHNTLPQISPSVYYAAFSCKRPVVQTLHNFRMICPGATLYRNGKVCELCLEGSLLNSIRYKCYRDSVMETATVYAILMVHRLLGTYKRIHGFIALTSFNQGLFRKLTASNRLFVKPNFMPCPAQPQREAIENRFVFIGRLDQLKGIGILLEAWKQLRDIPLDIIGDGPEKESTLDFIQKHGLKNVRLHGYLEKEMVLEKLRKSKALVVPSQWYEGFPMVIVESFANGVPVVAGNIGNLKEIVKDMETGILFQHDHAPDLVRSIGRMIEEPGLCKQLGENAFNTFKEFYDEDRNYTMLVDIYNRVAGEELGKM